MVLNRPFLEPSDSLKHSGIPLRLQNPPDDRWSALLLEQIASSLFDNIAIIIY